MEILKKEKLAGRPEATPLWKIWGRQPGNHPRYFLLDTKYQDYEPEIINELPTGSIVNLVLNQGEKHQFFKRLWVN